MLNVSRWSNMDDEFGEMRTWFKIHNMVDERPDWQKRIKEATKDMDYEDYSQCGIEDLISLAGLEEEVELALKQEEVEKRINKMKEDFK